METVVFGSGLMAKAVAFDLIRQKDVAQVYLIDVDKRRLQSLKKFLASPKVVPIQADATDRDLLPLIGRCAVAVSCVPYNFNLRLTQRAIAARTNFCDLGGNNTVVRRQFALNKEAKAAGITVVPDCGLAPGMTNILAADGVSRLEITEAIHIRVGGLPVKSKPPLFYKLVFSAQGLLNEYAEPGLVLEGGKIKKVPPLTGAEPIRFPKPFGTLEAFHTSGGSSTLPESFQGKVKTLDYKTIRYPGHRLMFRLLLKTALGNWRRVPRAQLACALERTLGFETDDVVLLRVEVQGIKAGKRRTVRYQLIDYADPKTELTAMMRTTGFSAAIVALLLGRGQVLSRGVLPGERAIPTKRFIRELRRRGFDLRITSRAG